MKKREIYFPLKEPYRADYNNYGANPQFYSAHPEYQIDAHNGVDAIAINPKSPAFGLAEFPVYAVYDQKIIKVERDPNGGWIVEAVSNEKFLDKLGVAYYWKDTYYHLAENKLSVKAGQSVMTGDLIAMGNASGWSPNNRIIAHLHYHTKPGDLNDKQEFIKAFPNNKKRGAVDPEDYWIKKPNGKYVSAYEIRSNLTAIAEALKKIAELVANLIKSRR